MAIPTDTHLAIGTRRNTMVIKRFKKKLTDIADKVHNEGKNPESSPRELIRSFGAERMTERVRAEILAQLDELHLTTIPPLEQTALDSKLRFFALQTSEVERGHGPSDSYETERERKRRASILADLARTVNECRDAVRKREDEEKSRGIIGRLFKRTRN